MVKTEFKSRRLKALSMRASFAPHVAQIICNNNGLFNAVCRALDEAYEDGREIERALAARRKREARDKKTKK